MRVCNLATALILFAAHASASHTEDELIDISELWDELQEDEDMQEIKDELESADADLYAEYWGYIEEVVAIVDAAVDAEGLYDTDFYDMDDFFYYLEEEEYEALDAELDAVFDELDAFLDRAEDNSDFDAAVQALIGMWEEGQEWGDTNGYLSQWYLSGDQTMWTQLQDLAATVIDPDTFEFVDNFDIDAVLDEVETTLAMTEAQDALLATFSEVLAAWQAVKTDVQDTIQTLEDSVDGIVTEYDAMVDDATHETSQKLMSIAGGVIDDIEESELLEEAYNEVEGYLDTANDWIGQEDWNTVYDEILDEVEGVFNTIKDDIDEGLPEREYQETTEEDNESDDEFDGEAPPEDEVADPEFEEVPDSAFSFAASAAALLASVAVLSF